MKRNTIWNQWDIFELANLQKLKKILILFSVEKSMERRQYHWFLDRV